MLTAMTLVMMAACSGGTFESELVFPFDPKHNHGSSIVQAANGDLIACWFHGSGERQADDVVIQGARKRKGFSTWSEPFVMADTPDLPDCNPVLFIDPRGKLWLFWVAIQDNKWGGALLKYRVASDYFDDGAPKWEWQDVVLPRPRNLDTLLPAYLDKASQEYKNVIDAKPEYAKQIAEIRTLTKEKLAVRTGWMTRLHPIMLSDHRMMLGLYSDVFESSLAAFTNDWGKTWEFSDPIMGLANIQPSFVTKKDGTITAMMRDNGFHNRIRYAESKDGGLAWSDVTNMEIPNPGSSLECIPLRDGAWVLVCNDTEDGRHKVTAYLSEDEGKAWIRRRALENFEPGKGAGAYPSVIQAADNTIHCTYSYTIEGTKGSTIKHVRFDEKWLRDGEKIKPAKKKASK